LFICAWGTAATEPTLERVSARFVFSRIGIRRI
jgi:hypothetical protein